MTSFLTTILFIVIPALCAIGWTQKIVGDQGILSFLPASLGFLPSFLFVPLFQCAACNSFWWAIGMYAACHYNENATVFFLPFAVVGLTTTLAHACRIT